MENIKSSNAWEEFQEAGLLWWINRQLHLFGWAICYEVNDEGKVLNVQPIRVAHQGFSEASEEMGFEKLTAHLKETLLTK